MDNDTITQEPKATEIPEGFTQVPFSAPDMGMTVDALNDSFGSDRRVATDIPEGFEPEDTGKQFWFQGIMDRAVGGEGNIAENAFFGFTEWLSAGYNIEEADQLKADYIKRLQESPGNLYRAGKYVGSKMVDQVIEDFQAADKFVRNPGGALTDYIKDSFKQESELSKDLKAQDAKKNFKEMGEDLAPGAMDVIDFTLGFPIKLNRIIQASILPDVGEKRSEQAKKDALRDPGANPMAKRIFERIDDPNDPIGMTATKMTISAVTGAVADVLSFNPTGVWRGIKNLPKSTQESYRAVVLNEVDKDLNVWLRDALKEGIKNRKVTAVREAGSTKELVTAEQIDLMTSKHIEQLAEVDPYFGAYLKTKVDQFSPMNKLRNNRGTIEFAPEPQRLKSSLKAVINSTKMPGVVAANQALGTLKNAGIKPEEIEYSGLEEHLKTKDKFTKQELLDFVEENKVKIEVVTKGMEKRTLTKEEEDRLDYLIKLNEKQPLGAIEDIEAGSWNELLTLENIRDKYSFEELSQQQKRLENTARRSQRDDDWERANHFTARMEELDLSAPGAGGLKDETSHSQWTLPGGTNYQEHAIVLPRKSALPEGYKVIDNPHYKSESGEITKSATINKFIVVDSKGDRYASGMTKEESIEKFGMHKISGIYIPPSAHHLPKNTVAHIRTNDRVSSDGKKVLFVEEIQSDWHLAGRQEGYISELSPSEQGVLQGLYDDIHEVEKRQISNDKQKPEDYRVKRDKLYKEFKVLQEKITELEKPTKGVPDAPFKKSYNELAIKQSIELAVEGGYDQVAFISGKQTQDRYKLSDKVNVVSAKSNADGTYSLVIEDINGEELTDFRGSGKVVTPKEMESTIGKAVSDKLMNGADSRVGEVWGKESKNPEFYEMSGLDLDIGGEWATTLYDKIIPKAADRYISQWGSKVKDIDFKKPHWQDAENSPTGDIKGSPDTQKGFDITPQMRQEVTAVGQPLFGNRVAGNLSQKLKSKKGFAGRKEQEPLPDDFEGKPQIFDDLSGKPPAKGRPGEAAEEEFNAAYEEVKDIWFGEKDLGVHKSQVEKRNLQKEIKVIDKDKAIEYDKAIQIYLDTKRNPKNVKKYYDKLTDEQKAIVDLSKNLPKEVKDVADKIRESYNEVGLNALENDVIKNVLDNYVARVWEIEGKPGMENFRKFGVTTRHAKQRKFDTIIEGWANGFELKVQGATSNLQILKEEIIKTIADKKFVESLKKLKTIDGHPLLSTDQLEGYKVVEHPNFKSWKFAGNIEVGKTYGKNFFTTEDGMVFERRDLFAPKEQADNINRVLGVSKLKGKPVIDFLTKYNALTKAWILQSSFFHHLAFMRSYYLGTNHKKFAEMSVLDAYKEGIKAIESADPIVELLVKKGLTLGIRQDWSEELLHEKTGIGVLLDKWKVSQVVKDKILALRQQQADFLFGELGAGLKAKSGLIEFRNLTKKYPNKDPEEIAEMVANLINDDFGGLHLGRLDRDPTIQHIFRLFALAPDWTESNIRSMVKAFTKGGDEGAFYRQFWAGIFTKAALLTVTANVLLHGKETPEVYKRAWAEGNLKWTGVDITPIYKALGGKSDNRKYFSIIGHFKDPIKFILHPVRSAQHKGSVLYRFFHEALTGVDWASRRFTTFTELIGTDTDKGVYKTTRKGHYEKGDPKSGKLKGKTVTWKQGKRGPLEYSQLPSFALSQVKGWQPVQVQNLIAWMAGEMEGFDALANSMGLGVSSTYGGSDKPIANLKKKYKIEDRIDSDDTIKKLMEMKKEDFDLYMSQYAEKTLKRVNRKIKRRTK